jgi:hypothetical protein
VDISPDEALPAVPALLRQLATDCQRLGADEVTATVYVASTGSVRSVGFASPQAMDTERMACAARTVKTWSVPVTSVGSRGVGRVMLALRNDDVLNPPAPPNASPRRGPTRLAHKRGRR